MLVESDKEIFDIFMVRMTQFYTVQKTPKSITSTPTKQKTWRLREDNSRTKSLSETIERERESRDFHLHLLFHHSYSVIQSSFQHF